MTGTFHHVSLFGRMASLRGRPAHFDLYGEAVERVISLTIMTDGDSGLIHCLVSVDLIMEGRPPYGEELAIYPFSQQREAQEDAVKVASELGYRLRRATPGVGWEWVDATVVLTPPDKTDLVIGG